MSLGHGGPIAFLHSPLLRVGAYVLGLGWDRKGKVGLAEVLVKFVFVSGVRVGSGGGSSDFPCLRVLGRGEPSRR